MYSIILESIYALILSVYELIDEISVITAKILITILISYLFLCLIQKLKAKEFIKPQGKAVLITGCDSGFGNLLANYLNAFGFRVYATVLDVESPGSQHLKNQSKYPDHMVVIRMNVTDDEGVKAVYEKVEKDLRSNDMELWALVNNAGYMKTFQIEWGTFAEFTNMFEVNVFGVVRVTRVFLPLIRKSKGRIVNVASVGGLASPSSYSAYSMTKFSVVAFSDALRREMYKFGLNVVTICPGGVKSINIIDSGLRASAAIWKDTEQKVKECYGEDFYKEWEGRMKKKANSYVTTEKADIVVNDMIDSICNCKPKICYKPIDGFIAKLIVFLFIHMPNKFVDYIDSD